MESCEAPDLCTYCFVNAALNGSQGLVDDKESLSLLVDFHIGFCYTPYNMRKFAFVCITFDLFKFNLDSVSIKYCNFISHRPHELPTTNDPPS